MFLGVHVIHTVCMAHIDLILKDPKHRFLITLKQLKTNMWHELNKHLRARVKPSGIKAFWATVTEEKCKKHRMSK